MAISMTCDGCGHTMDVREEHAGRRGKCKRCGVVVRVPSPELVGAVAFAEADDAKPEPESSWDVKKLIAEAEVGSFPSVEVLAKKPVPPSMASAMGREPWYYQVLVVYAGMIIGLSLAVSGVLAGAAIYFFFLRDPDRSLFSLLTALLVPVGIGFASAVIGAPILLGVDLARNVRVIRLQGHLVWR